MFEAYGDVLTVDDVAQALRIGRNSAYRLVRTGKIKSRRVGKKYRVPKAYLIEYVMNITICNEHNNGLIYLSGKEYK